MRILVCGDRNWTNRQIIRDALLTHLLPGDVVLQGGNGYLENGKAATNSIALSMCVRGADALAYQETRRFGVRAETIWADWDIHGRAAGPRRNSEMLKRRPRLVLAFHNDLKQSKGTRDMTKKALSAGVRVVQYDEQGRHYELELRDL